LTTQIGFCFRFDGYNGTFDNPPGYFKSAGRTVFGDLCVYAFVGFGGTTSVLSVSVLEFGMGDHRLVVYREVGFIPE
jgi:hypothetical protein